MIDIAQLEEIEEQVQDDPGLRSFVEESLNDSSAAAHGGGGEETVTRTGVEIAALWSLGLATLLVLRKLGLFGGSRKAQAEDTSEAAEKIAQAVKTLSNAGYDKQQAIAMTRSMYEHAAERADNTNLISALVGGSSSRE
jgi:hypothetical protein